MRTIAGTIFALALSTSAVSAGSVPSYLRACDLPEGTVLGANTAPEYAKLPGAYNGKWSLALNSALVIVNVDTAGAAEVLYSFDQYWEWGIDKAGCFRTTATLKNGTFVLKARNRISYKIKRDGELAGTNANSSFTNKGTFTKLAADEHPWGEQ